MIKRLIILPLSRDPSSRFLPWIITFSAFGSVSNGRGTNVQTTKRDDRNVVCAEGGRW